VTIQPYDTAAMTDVYGYTAPVETEQMVTPETVTGPETGAARSDRVFISSAARIYARFVSRVNSVLEEFVNDRIN